MFEVEMKCKISFNIRSFVQDWITVDLQIFNITVNQLICIVGVINIV